MLVANNLCRHGKALGFVAEIDVDFLEIFLGDGVVRTFGTPRDSQTGTDIGTVVGASQWYESE